MPHPDYPEHAKLAKVSDKSQAIGEFLEWLTTEQGYTLAKWSDTEYAEGRLYSTHESTNVLLAQFFDIDLTVLEAEKRAILAHQRELNDQADQARA
jgi:hypothetical protein